jgi:hypothetical protein
VCGRCWWQSCENDADYTVKTDGIRHKGRFVPVGDVDLCGGHWWQFASEKRLNLKWEAIEQALALRAARS